MVFSNHPLISHLQLLPLVLRCYLQWDTSSNSCSPLHKQSMGSWRRNQCHAPAQVSLARAYLKINQSQSSSATCFCSTGSAAHAELKTSFLGSRYSCCMFPASILLLQMESIFNACERPGITLKLYWEKVPFGKESIIEIWIGKVSGYVYVQIYFFLPQWKNKWMWH